MTTEHKNKKQTPAQVHAELTAPKDTALAVVEEAGTSLALPGNFTGLEEVGGANDAMKVYFRLLQKEDKEIDGSFPGALVDTLTNAVFDIRAGKGEPISIIPLAVVKDFEVYSPIIDSQGRIDSTKFGDKLRVLKEWDDEVQLAIKQSNKTGTRRSYVITDEAGKVEVLVQQCNKVFVLYEQDIYCLSLRGSKIQRFFTKWNRLMQRKRNPDGSQIPACYFQYELSSIEENNPQANADYWNFDIADGAPINDAQRVELEKQVAIIIAQRNQNKLNVAGVDVE